MEPKGGGSAQAGNGQVEDRTLIEQIVERRSEALAELYERFSSLLLALARRILNDSSDAEEVLQEVMLQVWNQADRYNPERSSVSTWLVLLTRSRSIDRLRNRKVVQRTAVAAHQENPTTHTSPTGSRNVLDDERSARLQEGLAALPPEQRQVLELAFFEGMTQRDIAESTDTPLGTVKTRTLLAMKKLRVALQDEIQDLL